MGAMQRVLPPLARLALALWIGSVACVSFLVAPRVFRFLDDNARAGELMGWIFQRVDWFGLAAAVLFVAAHYKRRVRAGVAALMGAAAAVNVFWVTPKVIARGEDLDFYHRLATQLWGGILILGLGLLLADARPPRGGG